MFRKLQHGVQLPSHLPVMQKFMFSSGFVHSPSPHLIFVSRYQQGVRFVERERWGVLLQGHLRNNHVNLHLFPSLCFASKFFVHALELFQVPGNINLSLEIQLFTKAGGEQVEQLVTWLSAMIRIARSKVKDRD